MTNGSKSSSSCPRCHFEALRAHADEAGARACPRCEGVWLTMAAARAVLPASLGTLPGQAAADAPRCPVCEGPLTLRCVYGVGVDVCAAHGVWFDHSEVERIRAAARHEAADLTTVDADSVDARTGPGPRKARIATGSDSAIDTTIVAAEVAVTAVDVAAVTADGVEVGGGVLEVLGNLFEGIFG